MRAKLNLRAPRVAKIAAGVMLVAVPSAVAAQAAGSDAHTSNLSPVTSNAAAASTQASRVAHAGRATVVTASQASAPVDHASSYRAEVHVKVNRHRDSTLAGRTVAVTGDASIVAAKQRLADAAAITRAAHATADARVKLQVLKAGRWRLAQHIRTNSKGRFVFHFRVTRPGVTRLRVLFVGSPLAHKTTRTAGQITGLTPVVASWYYDQGDTACGFHATYGVANKTLPCGTHVTISYGGRTVVATVDDRGPYVAGRDFDLDQNTAAALGFGGVGTIDVSRL